MSLFKTQKTTTSSKKIDSIQATVCEFGLAVPLIYGTARTQVNLVNYLDFKATQHKTTRKSGKSKQTTISYTYDAYLELAIAEGTLAGLGAIWVGDTKYASLAALNGAGDKTQGAPLSVNLGNNNNPTTYMQQKHADIANKSKYKNLAYLYGYCFLGEDAASVPSIEVEAKGLLIDEGDHKDANPAYVIRDILQRLGLADYIEQTSFSNYATYCKEADLLISTPKGKFNNQTKAQNIIAELLEITNAYMYWNTDRFTFVPRDDLAHGNWQPNRQVVYNIDADDLTLDNGGVVGFKRKTAEEVYNHVIVRFTNRAANYEEESVTFQDVDDIRKYGIKSVTLDALWLHTKQRAIAYAKAYVRKCLTEQNQYTLKLGWQHARLTAGDLLRVTDNNLGINGQIMMVSEVQEDNNGLLTVTAVQRATGNYSEATYTVANDYNNQDFNIKPSSTAQPLFIIPPADLTTSANGLEIWIALQGNDEKWGGCDVYVSDKDGDYALHGRNGVSSIYGQITSDLPANATSVNVRFSNPDTVQILTGSQYDAENGNTLIWINGECMSYTHAELTGNNSYTLSGLIRGQYATAIASHVAGESVAVLDGGIYVVPLTKHYQGKTMYFRFPSFNVFQANEQSLADVDDDGNLIVQTYTCNANTADLPNVTNLYAYNKYREFADYVTRYDIVVTWQPPDFKSYDYAQVWYKTNGTQASSLGVIAEGTTGANLGLDGKWIYGGQGYDTVTIPQAIIGDTYKIAVCTHDVYGNTETPDASSQTTILVAMKTETPNTPSNLSVSLSNEFVISWDEVINADVKYYEIRKDLNVGLNSSNFVARTTETRLATNAFTNRAGTIYVFAVSAYNKSSAPAKVSYNFPVPHAPTLTAVAKLQGIECRTDNIPTNCIGVHWYINGTDSTDDIKSSNNTYFYSGKAGVYEINAAFYDYFGDGYLYDQIGNGIMVTIAAYIPAELIESESITVEKLSKAAQDAIENGGINNINIAVKGVLNSGCALVMQGSGEYALVASNGEKLTGLFADEAGAIRLQGDYIHITGSTVIDGSLITNNMLAGGISADKIQVSSLSAICATIGTLRTATSGARMELESNQLRVYDSNGTLRVRLGVW